MEQEKAKDSVASCMAFSSRDWSIDRRDAWMWGIVHGWDDESMTEIAALHNWRCDDVDRLRRLRTDWLTHNAKNNPRSEEDTIVLNAEAGKQK